MKNTIIFSPHCDDTALSLGGAIQNDLIERDILVCDVFSVSNYTIMQQGTGNPKEVTKVRNEEEKRVMELLGASFELWGYPEPLLREEYTQLEDIFNPEGNPKSDKLYNKIESRIKRICKSNHNAKIFFPMGIGYHIDHLIVASIGLNILRENHGLRIYFYEDQPYAGEMSLDEITRFVHTFYPNFKSHTFAFDNVLCKMSILKHYKSQFDAEDIAWTYHHTQRRGGEVVWSTEENIRRIKNEQYEIN
ncbi:MAG: PIG-L deacetylase family protein [Candidatus Helarchaeota archaeon]